jgi:hypothetical protein
MWCAACRADVAAELSTDNRRMLCARCHSELGMAAGAIERGTAGPRSQDTERNARELLARWSTQHVLEAPIPGNAATSGYDAGGTGPKHGRRFDSAHGIPTPITANSDRPSSDSADSGADPRPKRRRRKETTSPKIAISHQDEPIASLPSHDDMVRVAVQHPHLRQGSWTTSIGQLCAYGGVALLTLGTVMVLSGYFGGPTNYATTGWLVSAVGQMLLFLGVVTLVSGGMEQTVDEVSWRIDSLAEHIIQLEKSIAAQQSLLEESRRRERRHRPRPGRSDAA